MPNRLNQLRNRSTGCGRPVEDRSRDVKNLLSPSSLLFPVEVFLLPVEVRSSTGRGPIKATVTCHALNSPTASEPIYPYLDRTRLPFAIFGLLSLETYKLRAPLHLLIREHLHSKPTYLFLIKKLSFLSLCIKSPLAYPLVHSCLSS